MTVCLVSHCQYCAKLRGDIQGFDEPGQQFEQIQQHHMIDPSAIGGKGREYDLVIYSIIKYFEVKT